MMIELKKKSASRDEGALAYCVKLQFDSYVYLYVSSADLIWLTSDLLEFCFFYMYCCHCVEHADCLP